MYQVLASAVINQLNLDNKGKLPVFDFWFQILFYVSVVEDKLYILCGEGLGRFT